ncbi:MAG TPA: TolC family protein, partial [Pirellulales bacterium]
QTAFSMRFSWLALMSLLLVSGCTWPVRQRTDQTVRALANQPYDLSPRATRTAAPAQAIHPPGAQPRSSPPPAGPEAPNSLPSPQQAAPPLPSQDAEQATANGLAQNKNELRFSVQQNTAGKDAPVDAHSAAWLESAGMQAAAGQARLQKAAWTQAVADPTRAPIELRIPARLPGSETPPVGELTGAAAVDQVYPDLPPLPVEPRMVQGPNGKPLTLEELQRIAAANSPALRQAVANVQQAIGLWQQARTYVNPSGTYFVDPTNNNATAGAQGLGIEQTIITGGKIKLSAAVAYKDVENAQLELRRIRNELATQVRRAYFSLLVDKETVAVSRALARFTDEIYSLSAQLLKGGPVAAYEPSALRAQAFTTRLAYQQAIATYIYDWKSLVAVLGLRQLPLTQVAGRVDRFIPYYDYDEVLQYVMRTHSEILRSRNLVPQAQYNLKLAQAAVVPDLDLTYQLARDTTVAPYGTYQQFQLKIPLAIWNRNKGNIVAAQASLVHATEAQHNTEIDLTNRLADAYTNYQNNLYAIDYYRRYILPDLVRYYRGVYQRRPLDPDNVNVGDLAFAQQNLSQNVTAYLDVLGRLWQSVVNVAELLQTDDLFQMATPQPLPELPDFERLTQWACGHPHVAAQGAVAAAIGPGAAPAGQPPHAAEFAEDRRLGKRPEQTARRGAGRPQEARHEE